MPRRRIQCSNNLKQLVLAMQNYESASTYLPPALGAVGPVRGTAHFFILPYIEQGYLYDWANGDSWNVVTVPVKLYWCPSDGSISGGIIYTLPQNTLLGVGQGATSYAVNFKPLMYGGNTFVTGMPGGTSNTVLFGERLAYCAYQANNNETISAWGEYYAWADVTRAFNFSWDQPIFNGPITAGSAVGMQGQTFDYFSESMGYPRIAPSVYQGTALQTGTVTNTTCDFSTLQSMHPNLVMVGMGDGSVHPVKTTVSLTTWQHACINWLGWWPAGTTPGWLGQDFY